MRRLCCNKNNRKAYQAPEQITAAAVVNSVTFAWKLAHAQHVMEDPHVLGTANRVYNTMHPCLINKIGRGRRKRRERERERKKEREGEGGRKREKERETYRQSRGCMDLGSCPVAVYT